MSDPRPMARCTGYVIDVTDVEAEQPVHCHGCAASDAREDRLREALERIADVCGGNESMMVKILVIVNHALADVPPRSDR